MTGDADKADEVEEDIEGAADDGEVDSDDRELRGEDSFSLKRKVKKDCDSRKRLEEKLEETRIQRQVQDYDFDGLD